MRLIGLIALSLLVTDASFAQPGKPFELHGLRPGMLTREIILYSHAPLDTILWGGGDGASIISFKGECLHDSGEFRVSVEGPEVTQLLFVSKQRDSTHAQMAFNHTSAALDKLYGTPEKYHNVYRIMTWEGAGQQLKLSTKDGGLFYSLGLTARRTRSVPRQDSPK
ncbi:MAG: hypothetical protein Q8922_09200 [Bacteroidota bacterium]|nr:hypothetical protein [Bacteroidota bacterium]MDP4234210.1 hypothetical protein [Bacteroidota bacterium]MDP4244130.1 hypothetical protein [Bacteroidota bacterium]MDP4288099.1 hypothetical protein [Bacteroidota bacterium]